MGDVICLDWLRRADLSDAYLEDKARPVTPTRAEKPGWPLDNAPDALALEACHCCGADKWRIYKQGDIVCLHCGQIRLDLVTRRE